MAERPPRVVGASTYETWALTLRAWEKDPTTPLDHLPQLEDDTYSPETYERFLKLLLQALEAALGRWKDELDRVLGSLSSAHDLGRDLVQLRSSLARWLQLSGHSSLPPTVRDALLGNAETSIARIQQDLETSLRGILDRSRMSRGEQQQILRTVHENKFTKVLGFQFTQDGQRPEAAALTHTDTGSTMRPHRFPGRRILTDI